MYCLALEERVRRRSEMGLEPDWRRWGRGIEIGIEGRRSAVVICAERRDGLGQLEVTGFILFFSIVSG